MAENNAMLMSLGTVGGPRVVAAKAEAATLDDAVRGLRDNTVETIA